MKASSPIHEQEYLRALRAFREGRVAEAETICRGLLSQTPNDGQVHFLLGMSLRILGRTSEALESLGKAAALQPNSAEILNGLGSVHSALRQYEKAAVCFARAIQIAPRNGDAHYNMGNACQRLREYDRALGYYKAALELNPGDFEAWTNLGNFHRQMNQHNDALSAYQRALAVRPDYALAHWNRAIVLLTLGQFEEGWREYEWRWKLGGPIFEARSFMQPRWNGQPIPGRTLLIYSEQGMGDAIQFVRFVKFVRPLTGRVILETPPALKDLFASAGLADVVVGLGEPLTAFDFHIPLMSLPLICGSRMENIPSGGPYLPTPPCTDFPRVPAGHLKVGLTWAGNRTSDDLAERSIPLEQFAPLFEIPNVVFFGLQVPMPSPDLPFASTRRNLLNLGPALGTFRHTAAAIGQLDLIISIDTAVAHLAGALGKPVWTLLMHSPDWRWFLPRTDSPWYPTMRLFRQTERAQWSTPIRSVSEELRNLANAKRE